MSKKQEDRKAKCYEAVRNLQKTASQLDAALSSKEQKENNRILALRTKERKAIRDLSLDEVIKNGTPDEKAYIVLRYYDDSKFGKEKYTREQISTVFSTFETENDEAIFFTYFKLYDDLFAYADKLFLVQKRYEVQIAILSNLISKYEAIQRDMIVYQILYGSCLTGKGHTGMSYNIQGGGKNKSKSLDETTPEALLAEFNEIHKGDGVIFKDNVKGKLQWGKLHDGANASFYGEVNEDLSGTILADIDFKGGLYDQIKKQAERCEIELSYVKAYIEPIKAYVKKNKYEMFAPTRLHYSIEGIEEERLSRRLIAKEYHISELNDKRKKGKEVTKKEEYEAVVPDYREVVPDAEVKESCLTRLKKMRDEHALRRTL